MAIGKQSTMRWSPLLGTLALLAACNLSSPAKPPPPGGLIKALLHGPASSDYLDALKPSLAVTTYDGSQRLEDYDLLIFDGDAHPAAGLKNDELVKKALRSGGWVMGVDLTSAHKKDALGSILNAASCGDSRVYAMRMTQDSNGRPATFIVEDGGRSSGTTPYAGTPPRPPGFPTAPACNSGGTAQRAAEPPAPAGFSRVLLNRLSGTGVKPLDDPPPSIPADLIYSNYHFTDVNSWTASCSPRKCNNDQVGDLQTNYTYTVFLNNKNNAQGDFQFVLLDVGIIATTARANRYVNLNGKDGVDWTNSYDDMSYFTGSITQTNAFPDDTLALLNASPANTSGEREITDESSFDIGYSSEGPGGNFSYSKSVTHNIQDWQATNNVEKNDTQWVYASANPFNFNLNWTGCGQGQAIWLPVSCYLQPANPLSLGTIQFHTQSLWKTAAVEDAWVQPINDTRAVLVGLSCTADGGLLCLARDAASGSMGGPRTYQFNLGAVIPIPIASLTFSPGASVKGGTPVTGTVTLARPAAVDTTVRLSSDLSNASVPPDVTVKQGQTSASFQILTNANNVPAGGRLVATIKAFYAEFFQTQLTLTN